MKRHNSAQFSAAIDATRKSLHDAAALVETLRVRIEAMRHELDTATIDWTAAGSAQRLANELLEVASMDEYDETTPEETVRERVLGEARVMFAQAEVR